MTILPDDSDPAWRISLESDDPALLKDLFERHYPLLVADIYRLIPDLDTCRDLAQEVFIELWTKRAQLRIQGAFRAYLRRAAINRALNYIKQQRRFVYDDEEIGDRPESSRAADEGLSLAEQDIREAQLHRAIEALPEKTRLVFCMSRFERMSHKEISAQLGISTKTIENQITRAMRLLRETLLKNAHLSPIVIFWLFYYLKG
ncbi:MAG: RNA polymerase sigma-70 factor [Saprospiraceae bacterium]